MILIDLPMPKACDVCPFNYDFCWCNAFGDNDEQEKHSDDWNDNVCDRETRPEYCPLKEIVRCKDCEHATMTADGKMCKYCEMDTDDFGDQRDVYHDADWFCTDGERKE